MLNDVLNTIEIIHNQKNELNGVSIKEKKSSFEETEELEKKNLALKNKLEKFHLLIAFKIITIFFAIIMLTNHIFLIKVASENTAFKNTMNILLPFMGQEKINELKSDWYLMENKDDYQLIKNRIFDYEKLHLK